MVGKRLLFPVRNLHLWCKTIRFTHLTGSLCDVMGTGLGRKSTLIVTL